MINNIAERVLLNKKDKGFPIGDIEYDIQNIKNELEELRTAPPNERGQELADIILFALGIGAYLDLDMETEVMYKLSKIENRTIKPLGKGQFSKTEGT